MINPRHRRFLALNTALTCLNVLGGWAAPGSEAGAADSAESVIELPTFKVDETADLPPREAWRYGTIPGFEIFSDASDEVTREWVEDVQTVLQLGEVVWPVKLATNRRTVLIFCKNAKSCADFGFIDYYRKNTKLTRIREDSVMDWEQHFFIQDTSTDLYREDSDRWKRISKFYSYQSDQIEPRPPHWIAGAGAALLASAVSLEGGTVILGRMSDLLREGLILGKTPERRPRLSEVIAMNDSVIDQLVVVPEEFWRPGKPPLEGQQIKSFTGAFHSFVQLCLLDKAATYEAGFVKFINRARMEPVTAKLFEECFGKPLSELEEETAAYEERLRFIQAAPVKKITGVKFTYAKLLLRDATDAEVGRIKGEALAMMEEPRIPARAMLRAPYVRGERDSQLLAAIGLYENKLGNGADARRFLESAVSQNVSRPRAYLELAELRLHESLQAPLGADGNLSAGQMAQVTKLLMAARALSPKTPEVYDMIAKAANHAELDAMGGHLTLIDEGLRLFPFHAELVCRGAVAFIHAGRPKEAAKLIDYGLDRFRYYEPGYRERLNQLRSALAVSSAESSRGDLIPVSAITVPLVLP